MTRSLPLITSLYPAMELAPILLLLVFAGGTNAFVYSRNEIKHQVRYDSSAQQIANVVGELTFVEAPLAPPTPDVDADPYCSCAVILSNKVAHGWDPRQIWIDVVIVVDTSAAMTADDVDWASFVIGWLFDDVDRGLITDPKAEFYTRVGVIAMSDEAKVLYNLNMTQNDVNTLLILGNIHSSQGPAEMDFAKALDAAQTMLLDGQRPARATTRQVIYFITDSEPTGPLDAADQFKSDNGVIIVNNFIKPGEARPGLFSLASPGYFLTMQDVNTDTNQMRSLQLFCKANCYCRADLGQIPYNGHNLDPAVDAAGGCFRAVPTSNQFLNARKSCDQLGGGLLTSIHDPQKGAFVQELMSRESTKSSYFWIGYTRTDSVEGQHWDWEDKSTNPYTNWADHQPSKSAYSKCAYVDKETSLWGDGNCNVAYPSVCEFAPCEVGNKNC